MLTTGLSEEFKQKPTTIFERSTIETKVKEESQRLQNEYETKLKEDIAKTHKTELVEKVDSYLNYVVEEWQVQENKIAIER